MLNNLYRKTPITRKHPQPTMRAMQSLCTIFNVAPKKGWREPWTIKLTFRGELGSVHFFFLLFAHFYFPASGQAVVTGVAPSPPRFLPSSA